MCVTMFVTCLSALSQGNVLVFLGNALRVHSKSCLYEFTKLNFLSVETQLPFRTLDTLID